MRLSTITAILVLIGFLNNHLDINIVKQRDDVGFGVHYYFSMRSMGSSEFSI